jgi:crossover junction endodeoxyribonuclease RuvC
MRIIGIDPGLVSCGWAVIDTQPDLAFVCAGTIATRAKDTLQARLLFIHQQLQEAILAHSPQQAAIEQTLVNSNARSSLVLAEARGAIILSLALAALPLAEYSPTNIKKMVTGNGAADKDSLAKVLKLMFRNMDCSSNHAADATAIAVTHALNMRQYAL